jgi:hypothetical protein
VDSGESAGSGSTEQAEEYGFGLIVTGVGGGNGVETMSGGGALEKLVPGAAAGGFQREMKVRGKDGNILGHDGGVERKLGGEFRDEAGVGIGVRAAQSMVEMKDDGHDSQCGGELGKSTQ